MRPLTGPDEHGRYGAYGGRFVPETLMGPLQELETAYRDAIKDPAFHAELENLFRTYAGRPTALTAARRLASHIGKGRIYLKREDLTHTAPIRSTMRSDKFCLLGAWAKPGLSRKPGRDSMAWPLRPSLLCSV